MILNYKSFINKPIKLQLQFTDIHKNWLKYFMYTVRNITEYNNKADTRPVTLLSWQDSPEESLLEFINYHHPN